MSTDLLMYKGDLGLARAKDGSYDLVLEEAGQSLLRRTVMTPPSWIRTWCIENNIVSLVDDNYGNRIYLQLSDPLNKEWISKAKAHIQNSLSYINDEELIEILSTSIGVSSSSVGVSDTANIQIDYQYKGKTETFSEKIRL